MEQRAAPCRSAPYGQACLNCFKAKCKCIVRAEERACERCHRLHKQCLPSDSVRTRHVQHNKDSSARIAQLEGKLEAVVSILQSLANSADSPAAFRNLLDQKGVTSPGELPLPPATTRAATTPNPTLAPINPSTDGSTNLISATESIPSTLASSSPVSAQSSQPSVDEAERYLAKFRMYMLPNLPFVHLETDLTADKLHLDKLFFFRAIVAVSATSIQHRVERGKELKMVLAQEILVENRSSLDLLLAVLTYVSWGCDHFQTKTETLSRLIMMAMSIVYDLGLNKPLPPDEHMIESFVPDFQRAFRITSQVTGMSLLERQRACLACFVLSSIISSYFTQIDAMRWSPQMEGHLRAVTANTDCPSDQMLAYQVRLQLLAQDTVKTRDQLQARHGQKTGVETTAVSPPTMLFLSTVQTRLHELQSSFSQTISSRDILMLHVHYIELCVSETGHTANSKAPVLPTTGPGSSSGSDVPNFERMEYLWRSVNAIKAWFDIFLELSPVIWRGLSFLFWAQLARCVVTLIRLSTLDDPSWDRQAVRNVVDLRVVLYRATEKMDMTNRTAGDLPEDELFAKVSKAARLLRAWLNSKIAPEEKDHEELSNWAGFADDSMALDTIMPWITGEMDGWASF